MREPLLLRDDGVFVRTTESGEKQEGQWRVAENTAASAVPAVAAQNLSATKKAAAKSDKKSKPKAASDACAAGSSSDQTPAPAPTLPRASRAASQAKAAATGGDIPEGADPEELAWLEEDPADEIRDERDQLQKAHFFTPAEAKKLSVGMRLVVLSDGGWCKAEIVEHEKSCLKVKWIGFPKEPLFAVSYSTAPTNPERGSTKLVGRSSIWEA